MRGLFGAIIVAVGLALVSLNCLARFAGAKGVIAYFAVGVPALVVALHWIVPRLAARRAGRRLDAGLVAATGLLLLAAFAVLYPLANSGRIGPGSDRDDALNVAAGELLAGRYPYYMQTYLHAPLTPMPGAVLLGLPFHLLGNAAYQNVPWMVALGGLLWVAARRVRVAVLLLGAALVGSPELLKEYVIGGDFGTNSIYVLTFMLLLVWGSERRGTPVWLVLLAAVGLGLGLSSRPNWLLLVPAILSAVAMRSNWRLAAIAVAVTLATTALVTLPFYLYDPAGFSPLHVQGLIGQLDRHLPRASLIVHGLGGLTGLLVAVLEVRRGRRGGGSEGGDARLALGCAAIQAVPLVAAAALAAIFEPVLEARSQWQMSLPLQYLSAGHIYVYFVLYAWACRRDERSTT